MRLEQEDRPYLVASVWGIDGDLPGPAHQTGEVPDDVPGPQHVKSIAERLAGLDDAPPPHPFWLNVEQRPIDWIDDWAGRPAGEPMHRSWYRFVDGGSFDEPWVDACRPLVLLDLNSWGAAIMAHAGELDHFAPTIELSARFVGSATGEPWLYSRADAPAAADGLIGATGTIWTVDRRIVALGGSTLLCRPTARRPDR